MCINSEECVGNTRVIGTSRLSINGSVVWGGGLYPAFMGRNIGIGIENCEFRLAYIKNLPDTYSDSNKIQK